MAVLKKYWWPGNIRELENLIERLVAVSDKDWVTEEDLPLEFHFAQLEPGLPSDSLFEGATNTFERNFILRALEKCGGNVTGTAEYLGIPLSTLKYKMDKLEVRSTASAFAAHSSSSSSPPFSGRGPVSPTDNKLAATVSLLTSGRNLLIPLN